MSDEKQKYENFKSAMGDGKTRAIFIIGLVIMIAIAVFAVFSFKKSANRGAFPASEVSRLPSVQSNTPDAAHKPSTPAYDNLIQAENQREAEKAKEGGGSAIPVMRAGVEQKPADQPQSQQQPYPQPRQDGNNDEEQKRQQAISARAQVMKNQVNLLITAWAPKEHTNMPVIARDGKSDTQGQGAASIQGQGAAGAAVSASLTRTPTKKAGDSCYAVLDTAVNTDEPSPVTATILQCGELDQSKIVGKVEVAQNAQTAVLRFTNINVPGQSTSLPMDGVAIDEATRRTSLATDVDNHYVLRYGSLFASAFLAGFGDALMKGGQNEQIVTTQTGAVVQRQAYDTKQLTLAGVGNVGKQAGANMGSVFNRSPTIKINAGIGIGILFMNDLTLK